PTGRRLQQACVDIVRAVRDRAGRAVCVFIDGLEKMNGEAEERFAQIFVETTLLQRSEWSAVIAAPPATLVRTYSGTGPGWNVQPVYGFGPNDYPRLKDALAQRFQAAGMDPTEVVEGDGLDRIVEMSGGLPRDAIWMAHAAVTNALSPLSKTLTPHHIGHA